VRVSNAGGVANSRTATITAAPRSPTITRHPASQTVAHGQTVTLTVEATGTKPLNYQWFLGPAGTSDNPIAGAIAASYTTPPVIETTRYWVRVSNAGGTANSATATITVPEAPPTITKHPESQTVAAGQTATLAVEATGSTPLEYQWYVGPAGTTDNPVPGATSAGYTTPPLNVTTLYWVRVSNAAGEADSQSATISVSQAPVLTVAGVQAGKLILSAAGPAGSRWLVLRSADLNQWQPMPEMGVVVLGEGPTTIEVPIGAAKYEFYQLTGE
jgi:hypothetical protein